MSKRLYILAAAPQNKTMRGIQEEIESLTIGSRLICLHALDNDLASKHTDTCLKEMDFLIVTCRKRFGDDVPIFISDAFLASSSLYSFYCDDLYLGPRWFQQSCWSIV